MRFYEFYWNCYNYINFQIQTEPLITMSSWLDLLGFWFVELLERRKIWSNSFHITSNFRMSVDDFLNFFCAQCVSFLHCLQLFCIFWLVYSIRSKNCNENEKCSNEKIWFGIYKMNENSSQQLKENYFYLRLNNEEKFSLLDFC